VRRIVVLALSVILALAVAAPIASGQPASQRQDVKALAADWWNWAVEEPMGQNPLEGSYDESVPPGDIQCDGSNPSGVWFLAGTTTGGETTRTCTVPADTALFFPVINYFCTDDEPFYPECAAVWIDEALEGGEPYATLDGKIS
jgi:hypothetical protein